MDMKYINEIAPEHDKNSCDDKHVNNGRYASDDFGGCYRCTLLEAARVPTGFKLVPVRLTTAMENAARLAGGVHNVQKSWAAMLDIAPQPNPEQEDVDD